MRKTFIAVLILVLFVGGAMAWVVRAWVAYPGPPAVICIEICNDGPDVVMYNDFHIYSETPCIVDAVPKMGWESWSDPCLTGAHWVTGALLHFMSGACDTFCIGCDPIPDFLMWELTAEGEPIATGMASVEMSIDETSRCSGCLKLAVKSFPNPTNVGAEIAIEMNFDAPVDLTIYDILGNPVIELMKGEDISRTGSIVWDGTNEKGESVPSGMYFYKVSAGQKTGIGHITILK